MSEQPETVDQGLTRPGAGSDPIASEAGRGQRKVRQGVVVSDKMEKTVVVRIEHAVRHRAYHKTMRRTRKLVAHDEAGDAHVGDTVRVMETRPLSKTKRWRVIEVVERAK
ncbi:MAG: 30S ribosomal protein S17 [Actinomycetota bacterium]